MCIDEEWKTIYHRRDGRDLTLANLSSGKLYNIICFICTSYTMYKVKVSSSSLQLIGQVLISCFCSREPAGPVNDGTLDTCTGWCIAVPAVTFAIFYSSHLLCTNYCYFHRPRNDGSLRLACLARKMNSGPQLYFKFNCIFNLCNMCTTIITNNNSI